MIVPLLPSCRYAGRAQEVTQMTDILLAAYPAVMGPVQRTDHGVQFHSHARAMAGLDHGAEMAQERFDLTPMDIAAEGFLKDRLEQAFVALAHRDAFLDLSDNALVRAARQARRSSHILRQ
jgi:hypothetical protein